MATELARDSLAAQVRAAVIDLIDEGLEAGDSLPSTAALSERFGVSRPVVREALSALQAMGVIELANGRNATVRELDSYLISLFLSRVMRRSPRPLTALMELRAPLEVQAATLAAQRISPEEGAALLAHVDFMAGKVDEAQPYVQLDIDLHRRIAQLSGNDALLWVADAARHRIFEAMMTLRELREERGLVGAERELHERIARAIARGDAEDAAQAMAEHMDATLALVRAIEA